MVVAKVDAAQANAAEANVFVSELGTNAEGSGGVDVVVAMKAADGAVAEAGVALRGVSRALEALARSGSSFSGDALVMLEERVNDATAQLEELGEKPRERAVWLLVGIIMCMCVERMKVAEERVIAAARAKVPFADGIR
eukprot:NODE_3167_length_820_cov_300.081046.p3 GENE.NODE_3167_length_820_cov_300.081046~~NODE_3167_length_820_cov_300.081046.p3  ORF type:complete len:139 (-),score=47.63 NODE_3167_length_820_cov_300.081046:179-595(-)